MLLHSRPLLLGAARSPPLQQDNSGMTAQDKEACALVDLGMLDIHFPAPAVQWPRAWESALNTRALMQNFSAEYLSSYISNGLSFEP